MRDRKRQTSPKPQDDQLTGGGWEWTPEQDQEELEILKQTLAAVKNLASKGVPGFSRQKPMAPQGQSKKN